MQGKISTFFSTRYYYKWRSCYSAYLMLLLGLARIDGAEIGNSHFRNQHVPNRNRSSAVSTTTLLLSDRSKSLRKTSMLAEDVTLSKVSDPFHSSNEENTPSLNYKPNYDPTEDNQGDIEWWPWHHDDDDDGGGKDDKNKTDDDHTIPNTDDNSNDDTPPLPDNSCASHVDCTTCYASSSACHWCAFDNQCHAKASWYGCTLGANCNPDNNDNDDNMHNNTSSDDDTKPSDDGGKKKGNSCHSHSSCSECSLSSHVCHWCEKDNACHAIGSWYGCAHGANCYSNHRCRRIEPEVMEPWSWWKMSSQIGVVPLALAGILGFMVVCCSSVLFTGVKALKGAYEDFDFVERSGGHVAPSIDEDAIEENEHLTLSSMTNPDAKETNDLEQSHPNESRPLLDGQIDQQQEFADEENDNQLRRQNSSTSSASSTISSRRSVTPHPSISRLPPRNSHRSSRHMTCLMTTCRIWYFLTLLSVFLFSSGYVYFFPKTPIYNVCSDEVAWKSIIDGITSLKMKVRSERHVQCHNPIQCIFYGYFKCTTLISNLPYASLGIL